MQRGILFLDAMRRRGNQYLEHTRAGMPPVLNYEMVLDGRTLERQLRAREDRAARRRHD
jgi:hypothetical protein